MAQAQQFVRPTTISTTSRPERSPTHWDMGQIALYFGLISISIAFCLPFIWLVSTSLKPPAEVFSSSWIPSELHTQNYRDVFEQAPVGLWLRNSLIVSVLASV